MLQRRRDVRHEARFEPIEDPGNPKRHYQALVPPRPAERVKPARHVSRDPGAARRVGDHWRSIVALMRDALARAWHHVPEIMTPTLVATGLPSMKRRLFVLVAASAITLGGAVIPVR